MRYLYMNNFRGFSGCVVPLGRTNFLVGENSTGKSSFLRLLNVLTHHMFAWDPTFAFEQALAELSFDDCVSAAADDRSSFEIGMIDTASDGDRGTRAFLYRFRNMDGSPKTSSALRWQAGVMVQVQYDDDGRPQSRLIRTAGDLAAKLGSRVFEMMKAVSNQSQEPFVDPRKSDHGLIPTSNPAQLFYLALPDELKVAPFADKFLDDRTVWIAPIRSAPKRFYGAGRAVFTPDGEHSPYVLRKLLEGNESAELIKYLRAFGETSGLYDAIVTHAFSNDHRSPFELLVRFRSAELTIDNVGYGVSQVLPLIVELLTAMDGSIFLVQQPEVHLHPRAQAALGALLYELAETFGYTYFIETHSDYLIDRYRLTRKNDKQASSANDQVLFFMRDDAGNSSYSIPIGVNGRFDVDQPREFRDFFIREEMSLLDL
jgi:energy-coupling factor transporter ATP-binding protein EcfA2